MTRTTKDPGDTVFPVGERLHEAFAEEVDRPGLEGPSFDAVLRSGTAQRRRRRAAVGTTFAVASVTAVATAVLATGGGTSHDVATADTATNTNSSTSTSPAAAASTTLASPAHANTPTPTPGHPADAVLTSGTLDGHAWQLVRKFTLDQPLTVPGDPNPPKGWTPQWCGNLDVIVDGVQTNAGNGNSPCLDQGGKPAPPADPANPGFASIAILDSHHDRLGAVVAGSVSPQIASVTAQCSSKSFTAKASQPAGDVTAYYTFTFPTGSACQVGTLSFFSASGSRTAFLTDVALEGGK